MKLKVAYFFLNVALKEIFHISFFNFETEEQRRDEDFGEMMDLTSLWETNWSWIARDISIPMGSGLLFWKISINCNATSNVTVTSELVFLVCQPV